MKNLRSEYLYAQEEVKRIQSVPLVIGQFLEPVDQNYGIVGSTIGPNYYVRILSTIDRELLKPNASVALHKHSNALVDVLPPEADSSIAMLTADEKPDVSYADIGQRSHIMCVVLCVMCVGVCCVWVCVVYVCVLCVGVCCVWVGVVCGCVCCVCVYVGGVLCVGVGGILCVLLCVCAREVTSDV